MNPNLFLWTADVLCVLGTVIATGHLMKGTYPRITKHEPWEDVFSLLLNAAGVVWILKILNVI